MKVSWDDEIPNTNNFPFSKPPTSIGFQHLRVFECFRVCGVRFKVLGLVFWKVTVPLTEGFEHVKGYTGSTTSQKTYRSCTKLTSLRVIPILTYFSVNWPIYIYNILTFHLAFNLTFYQAFFPAFYDSMWHLALVIEVPQCPLRSGTHSWGPAMPEEKEGRKLEWNLENLGGE